MNNDELQKWIIAKISFKEVIIKLIDMPTSIAGFCYKSSRGRFYILINARHSEKTQYKTLWHEIKHVYDFYTNHILRTGEICGLTWDNVNFEKKCIHITQALQRIGKEIIIKPPKSQTSIRTIYMTSYLYETLLEEYKRQEPLKEAYRKLGNFVCIHETGQPFCPDYLTHTFKKLIKHLGYPEIRFHDLRHTFATILLQAQTNPKVAAEILGHSDTKLFLNLYAHVLDEQKIKATQKLEKILE